MGIHIVVCIKAVVLSAPSGSLVRSPELCELNPFDRVAIEASLRTREEMGGKVTALSMGPESCAIALYEAMAMGVDRGVLVSDPAIAGSDTLATSTVLAAAIKKIAPFDLVVFGTRSSDSDTGHVGPQTSVLLDLPMVTWVHSMEWKGTKLIVERRIDEFLEKYEMSLPATLTIDSSFSQPREIGLSSIELAYNGRGVEKWDLATLDLSPTQVGEVGSPTRVLSWSRTEKKRKCEFITGSAEEQAEQLVSRLTGYGLI